MFIIALTPLVGLSFPALTPLIFAAAGALGYKVMSDLKPGGDLNAQLRQRIDQTTSVDVQVTETVLDSLQDEVKRAETLFFEKDGIVLAVMKDERGKLRIQVTGGKDANRKELEAAGRAFAEELAQLFAYNRAVKEAEALNAEVVEESTNEQDEIVLRVRRWT